MKFEYIGKEGKRFGHFAVRVDCKMMFGEYKSNPDQVKLNGAQFMNGIHGPVYAFSDKMIYKENKLPDLLVVLRKSYDAVFAEVNNDQGGE